MARKVKPITMFDYIAHIQKEDGTVVEKAGTMEFVNHNECYDWLQRESLKLGGWLISQHISESDQESLIPWKEDVKKLPAPPVRVEVPSVFADTDVFGEYKRTYGGAIPIKFKPKEEAS